MKKSVSFVLTLIAVLGLSGCASDETAVYVQPVSTVTQMGSVGVIDWYSGIVVAESVTEIQKDSGKVVLEVYVNEGQDVAEGQKLFSYDTEQLQLSLDKQRLEVQQLESSIENYQATITKLETDRERASSRDKLEYTVQIQTNQVDLKEAQLNLVTKRAEVQKSEHILQNAVVVSPVTGRVTGISESGIDANGNTVAFITIQKTGNYRVKGTINEQQRGL